MKSTKSNWKSVLNRRGKSRKPSSTMVDQTKRMHTIMGIRTAITTTLTIENPKTTKMHMIIKEAVVTKISRMLRKNLISQMTNTPDGKEA